MSETARRPAAVAVAIEAFFAAAWFSWAQPDSPPWLPNAVRVAAGLAVVVGLVGVIVAVRSDPDPTERSASMRGRGYRAVVALEIVAIIAGAVAFGASGHHRYIAAWVALVVGGHFVPLARVFRRPGLLMVGGPIVAVAVAAFVVGASSQDDPQVVAGLGTGAVLLVSAVALLAALRNAAAPRPGQQAGSRP